MLAFCEYTISTQSITIRDATTRKEDFKGVVIRAQYVIDERATNLQCRDLCIFVIRLREKMGGRPNRFDVTTAAGGPILPFAAQTEFEMITWLKAIRAMQGLRWVDCFIFS